MTADKHITVPAASLARAAPSEWEEFKKALRAYEVSARDNLVRAPATDVMKYQGMALQCQLLADLFDHAKEGADRMPRPQAPTVRN